MKTTTLRRLNFAGGMISGLTVLCAALWAFPIYWGVISSLKPEDEVIRPAIELWPDTLTFDHYIFALTSTQIGRWYLNSLAVAVGVTLITILSAMLCGYAISQLRFPGRSLLWWLILASFMVPVQALIINHFVLVANLGLLNSWAGIILPQLIHPVIIIVYKQFFDQVPADFREAAVMDNASELTILLRIYIPMNWGVTTALSIVCFIWTWNAFLWPFLSESVWKVHKSRQSFRNIRRIEANLTKARAFRVRFSRSFDNRRQRLSHANVRSTIHLFGRTSKPRALSERFTISVVTDGSAFFCAAAKIGP